ncbi:hypothetical protein ACSLN1_25740, partial [Escherichia coli]|uniref:hypothetical protein n=1 Tax=Escherichia coli TaxID=562 RepID=UPI003EE3C3C1
IVYQVGSQLEEIYSYAGSKTLLASAPCKIVYSASDVKDARELALAVMNNQQEWKSIKTLTSSSCSPLCRFIEIRNIFYYQIPF